MENQLGISRTCCILFLSAFLPQGGKYYRPCAIPLILGSWFYRESMVVCNLDRAALKEEIKKAIESKIGGLVFFTAPHVGCRCYPEDLFF